jgi:L-amino acid N-acyltransferase YncA
MTLDKLAYLVKDRCAGIFRLLQVPVGRLVYLRHQKCVKRALATASIPGSIRGEQAEIRPLQHADAAELSLFLNSFGEEDLKFFRPHGFEPEEIQSVLKMGFFMLYGLFVDGEIKGYCLLKLYPGRKAYLGTILSDSLRGCGLGKYMSSYLRWQASLIDFRLRATISKDNVSSFRSHESLGAISVVCELPNNYQLFEISLDGVDVARPELKIL